MDANLHVLGKSQSSTLLRMAILVPAELDLGGLQPESERNVIRQLLNGLDDDWYIVPKVPVLIEGQNAEIDVVLVSPHLGVVLLEIKGGLISVRDGVWYQYDRPLKKNPFDQVGAAKHRLIARLKEMRVNLDGFFMSEVVVLPDVGDIPVEGLGPGAPSNRIWGNYDLMGVPHLIGNIHKEKPPVGKERVLKYLRALCPTVELTEVG
ncbi:MAG: NERD domain-containing protein, partial [Planctomycetes bacterium]|nr:NERD domain-containing protein [Planctomycetota bacterium]